MNIIRPAAPALNPLFQVPTCWAAIETPADASALTGNPALLRLITEREQLSTLPPGHPAREVAMIGVPRGDVPIVPLTEFKHPVTLSRELKELIMCGASSDQLQAEIAEHMYAYDRPVMELLSTDPAETMKPWQTGRQLYVMGVMEHCIGEGLCKFIDSELMHVVGIIRYFADIADSMTSLNPATDRRGIEERRQYRVMQRLVNEMAHLQDARLADGIAPNPALALSMADIQSIAVMKGLYTMVAANPQGVSSEDSLRSAAYMFDLVHRYEAGGARLKARDIEAALEIAPIKEYAGDGHKGLLSRLDEEIDGSVGDALMGYFDETRDVPASIEALYDYWDERYAGAYLYRRHVFQGLADRLRDEPEGARFAERAALDAAVAEALFAADMTSSGESS